MRRKEERSKQGRTNKQGKATQHTQGSHFIQMYMYTYLYQSEYSYPKVAGVKVLLHEFGGSHSPHSIVCSHQSEHLVAEVAQQVLHNLHRIIQRVVVLDQQLVVPAQWAVATRRDKTCTSVPPCYTTFTMTMYMYIIIAFSDIYRTCRHVYAAHFS